MILAIVISFVIGSIFGWLMFPILEREYQTIRKFRVYY